MNICSSCVNYEAWELICLTTYSSTSLYVRRLCSLCSTKYWVRYSDMVDGKLINLPSSSFRLQDARLLLFPVLTILYTVDLIASTLFFPYYLLYTCSSSLSLSSNFTKCSHSNLPILLLLLLL